MNAERRQIALRLGKTGTVLPKRGLASDDAAWFMPPNGSTIDTIALACAAFIILLIGWSRFYDPFAGDQALFLIGAEKLHAGGVLYHDFWDIKQPGVFAFFLFGGLIFGFNQIGEHAADLTWQLAFAVALVFGLRACFMKQRFVAAFAPIAVVGAYYAGSSSWHLLQVEELVGLPLFCCTWLLGEALRKSSKRLAIASGLFGGVVLSFKLIFLVIVVGLVVAVVFAMRATVSRDIRRATIGQWLIGVLIPIALVVAYAVLHSTETATLRTTFVIPMQVLFTLEMHAPVARLADSSLRFLLYFRGLILLGLIGLLSIDRTCAQAQMWRLVCIAWIISDTIVIAMQISSWWQYHFLLLIPPVGILATFGLASIIRNGLAGYRRAFVSLAVAGIVAYVAVPLPQGAIGTIMRVGQERPFDSADSLERYRTNTNSEYADALEDSALARHRAAGATVYVFGDPLIYLDSNTAQAIAMNSWAIQLFTPALWRQTVSELCEVRPEYVFVFDRFVGHLQRGDHGAALSLLSRDYVPAAHTRHGEWFKLANRSYDAHVCGSPLT